MKRFFYSLLFVFSINHCLCALESEKFYFRTFPGQGNFSIIMKKIKGDNIAFIFDAGISSQQTHEKLLLPFDTSPILSPIKDYRETSPISDNGLSSSSDSEDENQNVAKRARESEYSSPERLHQRQESTIVATTGKYTNSRSIEQDAKGIFTELNIKYAVIFISHLDKDHINKVKIIPDSIPKLILAGLEGDENIFNDIQNAQIINADKLDPKNPIVNCNLTSFFERTFNDNSIFNTGITDLTHVMRSYGTELDFIHFWLFNPQLEDKNSKSYIMSCTNEDLNLSFLFTGDATESTFKNFQEQTLQTQEQKKFKGGTRKLFSIHDHPMFGRDHLIFALMPHHGSKHNSVNLLLTFFKPSAFICASGNGMQYGHPHKNVIEELKEYSRNNKDKVDNFWKRYEHLSQAGCFYFDKQDHETGYSAYLYRTKKDKLPILGTNYAGMLSMDSTGEFFQERGFNVQIGQTIFECAIEKRSSESPLKISELLANGEYEKIENHGLKQTIVRKVATNEVSLLLSVADQHETSPKTLFYKMTPIKDVEQQEVAVELEGETPINIEDSVSKELFL